MYTSMKQSNSGENRNYTETVSARVSSPTKEHIDRYREQNDLGKSQALRQIIRDGLDPGTSNLRRDIMDLIFAAASTIFAISMIYNFGYRAVIVTLAGGLLVASLVYTLKFGPYAIQVFVVNRKKAKNMGMESRSGIWSTPEPHQADSPVTGVSAQSEDGS